MPIGTPIERYAQDLPTQGASSVFSPASAIVVNRKAFLFVTMGGGKDVTTVTDSVGGNTWVVDAFLNSGGPSVAIWSCQVNTQIGTSDTVTVNYSPSTPSNTQIWIQEVPGLTTSLTFDKTASATNTDTNPQSTAIGTLSQPDEIIWALMRTNTASTWTKGAGNTDATTPTLGSPPSALEYRIVSDTSSVNMAGTLGTSGAWVMVAATYKALAVVSAIPPISQPLTSGVRW